MREKAPTALRSIGELAQELALEPHVLRYWETQFPQIKPLKRKGGRRYYRPQDAALIRQVRALLHERGYTIKGAQQWLSQEGAAAQESSVPSPPAAIAGTFSPAPQKKALHSALAALHRDLCLLRDKAKSARSAQ